MSNPYGVTLDPAATRWAAAENVSETVIAAVLLLHERSVEEILAKLGAVVELEQVIKLVGRSPGPLPTRDARYAHAAESFGITAAERQGSEQHFGSKASGTASAQR
jgi:hypothetical protein